MKILCSGNPLHKTIASGIKQVYPNAEFASRSTGFDLRFWDDGSERFFREKILNYNVFINSSFICKWGQQQILETVVEEWKNNGIKGHVVNIGSSAEFDGVINSKHGDYSLQKNALKGRGLQLNNKNGIRVTHITVGGINDGKPGHEHWIDPLEVAELIKWVLERDQKTTIAQVTLL